MAVGKGPVDLRLRDLGVGGLITLKEVLWFSLRGNTQNEVAERGNRIRFSATRTHLPLWEMSKT